MANKIFLITALLFTTISCVGQSGLFKKHAIKNDTAKIFSKMPAKKSIEDSVDQYISNFYKSKEQSSKQLEISCTNTFVQDPDSTYLGEGLFSDYSVRRDIKVLNLPLNIQGHLVLQNSTINKRFSGIKIGFDTKEFVRAYQQNIIRRDVSKMMANNFPSEKLDLLEDMGDNIGKKMLSKKLGDLSTQVQGKLNEQTVKNNKLIDQINTDKSKCLDSLEIFIQMKKDSILRDTCNQINEVQIDSLKSEVLRINAKRDTLIHQKDLLQKQIQETQKWIEKEQKNIEKLNTRSQLLAYIEQLSKSSHPAPLDTLLPQGLRKDSTFQGNLSRIRNYDDYQKGGLLKQQRKVAEMRAWEEEKKEEWDTLDDPNELKKYAKQQSILVSPLQSLLLGIKKLEIGTIQLQGSPLIIGSMPANGFSGDWQSGKYTLSATIGKEGKSSSRQATDFIRNTNRYGLNRSVAQIKAEIGDIDRTFYGVSLTRFTSNIPLEITENPIPQHTKNILLGLHGSQYLSKSIFINANTVFSNTDISGATPTPVLLNPTENKPVERSAIDIGVGYNLKESVLEAGYSYIGAGYNTLGNPFLITNRKDIKIKIKQKMLKKRLVFIGEVRLNTNISNTVTPQLNQNLYSADLSWRINKKGSRVWVKYQPMIFAQQIGETKSTIQLNTAVLGCQTSGKIGKSILWNSVFQGMNFRQEANATDTAFTTGRIYLSSQQTLSRGAWMTSVNSYGGFERLKAKEGQLALTNTYLSKKVQLDLGIQIMKRPFDDQLRKGISGGFSIKIKKKGDFGVNCLWLKQIEGETKNGFYGTSFLRLII